MTKTYLTGVRVREGQFSSERVVSGTAYNGDGFCGFFPDDHLKNGNLEVIILYQREGLSLVGPIDGHQFMESREITVSTERLLEI